MPIPPVALKRRNHRLLLCEQTRKPALLAHLIETHRDKRIASRWVAPKTRMPYR